MDNQHDGVFAGASIAWEADLLGALTAKRTRHKFVSNKLRFIKAA